MTDRTAVGDIIDIPKLGKRIRVEPRYDYAKDRTRCPVCTGAAAGVPWGGWFSCQLCPAVALVDTGESFMPVPA